VRDIAQWLQELGLAKYAQAFADNEIDIDAVPYLTEHMLEQIGLPIGARAKVLAAISGLAASSALERRDRSGEREGAVQPGQQRQPERRQMTVMFCDLVDSTKLARSLDPEDFRALMEAYQKTCGAVIERYEGHVAQYRGDGIEVYFGWPAAQEDAAERAVRAGLDIVEAVKAVKGPESLSVRVGISTGIVVIGETGFGDPSTPSGAVGDTPYVAARLQTLAAPGSVVIAEPTSRLTSAWFELEEMGPQNLKGIVEPIRAFRVRRVRDASSRFRAAHTSTLTPLLGRHSELALLQQRWRDAAGGEGQIVFVSGVPGVGKSRIVHELEQWMEPEPHFSLQFQCLPHCMQSALFPVIQQIERLAGLAPGDSDGVRLDKVEALMSMAAADVRKEAPFVAEMLSIPVASRYPPLGLTAQQVKTQTLFVLVQFVRGLAAKRPVFCVVEDAQWIDPSTQELLDLLVGQIEKARILLVVTHRPDYQPRAGVHDNVSSLTLSRLTRHDVTQLAQLALRDKVVPEAVMQRIVDESDSIPLFVEELARAVSEAGGIGETSAAGAGPEPSASWSVPASLRDALVARLDRAPQGRRVAQMAAVVGREFSYDMLLHVSSMSSAELDSALAHLQRSEIVQQVAAGPAARYAFKHALVRDAAYESLLKSSRRELHARVGEVIERERPEVVTGQPELLAYHYGLAGDARSAVRFWLLGGQRARSRSANVEATRQFQKALEFLQLQPETPERSLTELEIQLSLGLCFIAVSGYSSDDTRRSFERACSLSAQLGEPQKEMQAIFGLWGHYWMRARHDRAIGLGVTLLARAELIRDPVAVVVGHRMLGSTLFTLGDFIRAREHLERAIALAERPDIEGLSVAYAVDPRIAARLMLAWDLWILGYAKQALDHVLQALAQAFERNDPYSLAFAHYVTSAVHLLRGEPEDSLRHADQSLMVSKEHRIQLYALYSRFGRGCALGRLGRRDEAMAEIQNGIEEASKSNLEYMRGFMLGWLATLQVETGDPEAALWTVDVALRQVNDVTGRAWEAELHRLRGEILLAARPDAAGEAERNYLEAIAVAQRQQARSLELRASVSLARLLQGQGRQDEARTRLAPIYGWFTEGLDTVDLRDAKTLLAALK
jgi:class 3 adenylate cyclase/predicted ATPase